MTEPLFTADDIISVYTRAQAIEDGFIVPSTALCDEDLAAQAGFRFPVAFTNTVADRIIAPPRSTTDTKGRLWDVLWMAKTAVESRKRRGESGDQLLFSVILGRRRETLKLLVGPGDNAEPVITIMLPHED